MTLVIHSIAADSSNRFATSVRRGNAMIRVTSPYTIAVVKSTRTAYPNHSFNSLFPRRWAIIAAVTRSTTSVASSHGGTILNDRGRAKGRNAAASRPIAAGHRGSFGIELSGNASGLTVKGKK